MENKVALPNGIQIWFETFGKPLDPAVLLNMGNSCDAVMWPDSFCEALSSAGFYVIRFDQRDTGLSTWVDFNQTPYTLLDMVEDMVQLLRVLKIDKAHIVGYSTGGLNSQLFAIHHPDKILTLTLLATSTDLTIKNDAFRGLDTSKAPLPPPTQEFIKGIFALYEKPQTTIEEKVSFLVGSFRLANGSKSSFDAEFFTKLFTRSLKRVDEQLRKGGHESNHALATSATPLITPAEYTKISAPTLIISGSEDPIFPPPHGLSLAKEIKDSKYLQIEGMGHVLNPVFYEKIVSEMVQHMKPTFLI